jgi:ABC-type dipeptide/oligopeptide/nickel transport system permease subunit
MKRTNLAVLGVALLLTAAVVAFALRLTVPGWDPGAQRAFSYLPPGSPGWLARGTHLHGGTLVVVGAPPATGWAIPEDAVTADAAGKAGDRLVTPLDHALQRHGASEAERGELLTRARRELRLAFLAHARRTHQFTTAGPAPRSFARYEFDLGDAPLDRLCLRATAEARAGLEAWQRGLAVISEPEQNPALGAYVLGTDNLGRDVLLRLLEAQAAAFCVGGGGTLFAIFLALAIGIPAGYFGLRRVSVIWLVVPPVAGLLTSTGRWGMASAAVLVLLGVAAHFRFGAALRRTFDVRVEHVVLAVIDTLLCLPWLLVVMVVLAILPRSLPVVILVLGATSWMGLAKIARAEAMVTASKPYIQAPRVMGRIGHGRILVFHVLPQVLPPVLIQAGLLFPQLLLAEAGLSFLGLGIQPGACATFGNMFQSGVEEHTFHLGLLALASACIVLTTVLLNLAVDAVRAYFAPAEGV